MTSLLQPESRSVVGLAGAAAKNEEASEEEMEELNKSTPKPETRNSKPQTSNPKP